MKSERIFSGTRGDDIPYANDASHYETLLVIYAFQKHSPRFVIRLCVRLSRRIKQC